MGAECSRSLENDGRAGRRASAAIRLPWPIPSWLRWPRRELRGTGIEVLAGLDGISGWYKTRGPTAS